MADDKPSTPLTATHGPDWPDDGPMETRRAPGTCCPEPTCDHEIAPTKCRSCGAQCPCGVWELAGREVIWQCRLCECERPTGLGKHQIPHGQEGPSCPLCGARMHWATRRAAHA